MAAAESPTQCTASARWSSLTPNLFLQYAISQSSVRLISSASRGAVLTLSSIVARPGRRGMLATTAPVPSRLVAENGRDAVHPLSADRADLDRGAVFHRH